jgi:polyhydroxyalkanoate synthesis regulator phasin
MAQDDRPSDRVLNDDEARQLLRAEVAELRARVAALAERLKALEDEVASPPESH